MTPSSRCFYHCQFTVRVAAMFSVSAMLLSLLLSFHSGSSMVVGLATSSGSGSGSGSRRFTSDDEETAQSKMVLGSRPPACVNKCKNCQPCRATLVIPPHPNAAHREDDSYYLLSWKCRCGGRWNDGVGCTAAF